MFGLPAAYWFLFAGVLVNRVGSFVLVFLTLYLTNHRGFSPSHAGIVVGLYGVGALCAGPVGGTIADRVGRRMTLLIATVAGGLAMLQLGWAVHPLHVAVSSLLLGFFGEMYRPAANASVVDVVPEPLRVRAFGYLYWAANLGFAAAASIGGMLVHADHYRWLFILDAATTFAFGALVLASVPESLPAPHPDRRPDALRPYRDRRLMRFLATQFLTGMVFQQCASTLPIVLQQHGFVDKVGWLLAINGALIGILQPISIHLLAGASRSRVMAVGTFLVGLGFGATGLGHSVPWYALSIVVWTVGEIVFTPVTPAIIGDLAPLHLRGTYQGALHVAFSLAAIVGPALGTVVLQYLGAGRLWLGCVALGTLAALIHLSSGGYEAERLQAHRDALG